MLEPNFASLAVFVERLCVPGTVWGAGNAGVAGNTPAIQELKILSGAESDVQCGGLSGKEASEAEIWPCTSLLDYDREGGWKPAWSLQNWSILIVWF